MKYSVLFLLTFAFCAESIAQTLYESPHVKDGKTIQLTIPNGFYETVDMGPGNTIFSTQEDVDPQITNFNELEIGVLMVMHIRQDGEQLESLKGDMEVGMEKDGARIISAPEIVNIKGNDCLFAAFDGDFMDEGTSKAYFAVMGFGDYFLMVNYISSETLKNPLEFKKFKEVITSYSIVATDKEDGMVEEYDEYFSEDDMEDYSVYFTNDLFETEISYYDILPDTGYDWDDYIDESGHLLSMFSYKTDRGFMKIFSGGLSSNYPSEEEMADAIEKAMEWGQSMTLSLDSQFSNEDHYFKLYSISGGGTMTSVYTTIVNRELVFFVVDGGDNPDENFKPAVREFMLTMWVDYFIDEE